MREEREGGGGMRDEFLAASSAVAILQRRALVE